jgi:hypothetical protein
MNVSESVDNESIFKPTPAKSLMAVRTMRSRSVIASPDGYGSADDCRYVVQPRLQKMNGVRCNHFIDLRHYVDTRIRNTSDGDGAALVGTGKSVTYDYENCSAALPDTLRNK